MRLTRIYQPQALNTGQIVNLTKEAAGHLIRVLRLQVGDEFIVFNGKAGEFRAIIIELNKSMVKVKLGEFDAVNRESSLQITLAQAVLRSDKMDYMLQKAVELGVTRLIPMLTAHSTLKLAPERWQKRSLHWQGVMLAACEQSGRTRLPKLENPMTFDVATTSIKADQRIILQPGSKQNINSLPHCQSVALLVGPEGGWSENELKCARVADYSPMQMGPRVLRAETAGLAAVSIVQSLYGDL
ncbi:16S rRNA (uracil(1498)-N(3))-methyltransferase [Rickettsiella endosymbiont of Miltochrista miniata]|uniref:16S rRNA (uracil(1498)-N(3))-methyltransferase n=1 Tax=Rickettsiella endosymbiont of Miltochrista miniata TaxID=3066239 RepID=UPI00313C8239